MTRRRVLLGILLVLVTAAAIWFGITLVNMVRLGPRGSDPGAYWIAFALILAVGVGLVWAAWRVADLLFGDRAR